MSGHVDVSTELCLELLKGLGDGVSRRFTVIRDAIPAGAVVSSIESTGSAIRIHFSGDGVEDRLYVPWLRTEE